MARPYERNEAQGGRNRLAWRLAARDWDAFRAAAVTDRRSIIPKVNANFALCRWLFYNSRLACAWRLACAGSFYSAVSIRCGCDPGSVLIKFRRLSMSAGM